MSAHALGHVGRPSPRTASQLPAALCRLCGRLGSALLVFRWEQSKVSSRQELADPGLVLRTGCSPSFCGGTACFFFRLCLWPWVCCSDVVSSSLPLPPLRVPLLLYQHAEGLRRCESPKACSCPEVFSRDLRDLFFRDKSFRVRTIL